MSDLPSGWAQSTLGEVCSYPQYGWTTRASSSGEVRLLRTTDITSGTINWESVPFCLEAPADTQKYQLDDGDIVVSRAGSVGKSLLIREPQRSVFASYLIRLRPLINASFVAHFLNSGAYWKQITEQAAGIALPNINASKLRDLQLPVPPKPEQKRIVSKINELFSRIAEGERALERTSELVERYRQSVLKAAVTGELTRAWREKNKDTPESGEALLASILRARREAWEKAELEKMKAKGITPANDKWKQRYKEPRPADTSGLSTLPTGWTWATVEQLSTKVVDGVHKKPNYVPDGIPFVTVKNLTAGPGISFEKLNYITIEDHAEFIKRTNPERGDVLVSKDGTLGVVRVIRTDKVFSIFVSVALVKPVLRRMSEYLGIALSSPVVQVQMVPKGSGLQHIHLEDLRRDCVPLCGLEEQAVIVEAAERHLASIDHFEKDLVDRAKLSSSLRRSILKSGFSGSLVEQDPSDEPASVLLDHIAAVRGAHTAAPKRGRRKKTTA